MVGLVTWALVMPSWRNLLTNKHITVGK